ncbi:hypothetical protein AN391_02872 [Pseudoalteromonas sp. P1-13-1a]|uniref:hypothetical protein n=1 Tax=Pseudoalteromonas sp. P1-13-1a TaxID=1723756 RepID=UPI0006D6614D|nr:hypothetical protein [Pseudoalteromonas sp. P1-13-1a]KPZ54485.1 hypothetical protein AN391_02872 [Pseudoalteromonas sp. P1-13-1a]
MDVELKKKVDIVVGLSRLAGGVLILIGSILVFFFVQAALDPNAVIEINGVPTKDESSKIFAAIFSGLLPLIGIFLSFVPSKHLDKWVAQIIIRLS